MADITLAGCFILKDKKILLLHRKDHQWWETPSGKIKAEECENPTSPTIGELAEAAHREAHEELGKELEFETLRFAGDVEITLPDGRTALATKFYTKILKGAPKVNEPETFDKLEWIPLDELQERKISPDLALFVGHI